MFTHQFNNGAYRIVRDDGLVIAEVAGKNQLDPCSDGNLVAWASFAGPPYVICSRTVDGSTLGPIVQHSQNTNEHAIHPFLANGWLFWSQCRNGFSTWAKNLSTGAVIGPWVTSPFVGGAWSWASTPTRALAVHQLHWGKTYFASFVTGIMFDFVAGNFMTFDPAVNPDTLNLAQKWYPGGLIVRNIDQMSDWTDRNGDVITVTNVANGSDFVVTFSVNQRDNDVRAKAWNLYQRVIHQDGTMEPGMLLQNVPVQFDTSGQTVTQAPSWL